MARLGVITGLVSELDCLAVFAAADRPLARCAGIGAAAARKASRSLIEEGCTALLSLGMAGGLDPALKAGAVVIAERVVTADGRSFVTSEPWRKALVEACDSASVSAIAGSERVVTSIEEKQNLRRHTGAAAVDMESVGRRRGCRRGWTALHGVARRRRHGTARRSRMGVARRWR